MVVDFEADQQTQAIYIVISNAGARWHATFA